MHIEQLGPYTLTWSEPVFPLGSDTLHLGRFATVRPRWRVCDLGTGSGALLLLLAQRQRELSLFGVDSQPQAVLTARENLLRNGLEGEILSGDLRRVPLTPGSFDLVISNPPYFPSGSGGSPGPTRMEGDCQLSQLCAAAARLTRNGGRFALCHRPERLAELFIALRQCNLEPKRLQPVAHSLGASPFCILVEAVRQGRPGLDFLPTLFEHPPQDKN